MSFFGVFIVIVLFALLAIVVLSTAGHNFTPLKFSIVLLALSIPFEHWLSFYLGPFRVKLYDFGTLLVVLAFLVALLMRKRRMTRVPLIVPLFAFILSGAISVAVSIDPHISLRILLNEIFILIVLYGVVVEVVNSDGMIGLVSVCIATIAVLVGAVNTLVALSYYTGIGIDLIPYRGFIDMTQGRVMWPATEPVVLGVICVGLLLFLVGTISYIPGKRYRWLWRTGIVLMTITLLLTIGRSAYLGAIIGVLYYLWDKGRVGRPRRIWNILLKSGFAVVILAFISVFYVPQSLDDALAKVGVRLSQTTSVLYMGEFNPKYSLGGISAQQNLYDALESFRLARQKPWLGHGMGTRTVRQYYTFAYDPGFADATARGGSSNVLPFMIFYERGILGVVIFLWLIIQYMKLRKEAADKAVRGTWSYACLHGVPVALLGVLVTCTFFDNSPYLPSTWVLLGLFAASARLVKALPARRSANNLAASA